MSSDKLPTLRARLSTGNSESSADIIQLPTPPEKQNKYVATACEACKKTKRKCDGNSPCKTCAEKGRECVYDQAQDGRRGRKRTLDDLTAKIDAFDTVLESLRTSDDKSIQDLVQLVRSGADVEQITEQARVILRRDELRNTLHSRLRANVMSIASVSDIPPIQVPAKPWTSVTDDDEAVSHLISVYFTWHRSIFPTIDEDIFVSAMKSQSLASLFCSPFLVNSMCAMACMYTDHPSAFAVTGETSSRGIHFRDEATRLWDLEEGKVSLTNLQAMPAILSMLVVMGKDRVGLLYAGQMLTLNHELIKKVKKTLKTGHDELTAKDFQQSYRLAIWGTFACLVDCAVAWQKPLDLEVPRVPRPYAGEELEQIRSWRPYPKMEPEFSVASNGIVNASLALYAIGSLLLPLLLSGNPRESPLPGQTILDEAVKLSRLHDVEEKLDQWYRELPSYARADPKDNSQPVNALVDLHLMFNVNHMIVQNMIIQLPGVVEGDRQHSRAKMILACRRTASLYTWLQRTISLNYFPGYAFHGAAMSAYNLLDYLLQEDVPDTFHTMIVALSATSRRWTIARGVLKMLWIELHDRQLVSSLSEPTAEILRLNAVDRWGPQDHTLFESCIYPNYSAVNERGRELADMGELLQQYSRLNLDERMDDSTR